MDAATSAGFISTSEVLSAIRGGRPPLIIDVRRDQAFRAATAMIAGALWRDTERVTAWAGERPRPSRGGGGRAAARKPRRRVLRARARGQPECRNSARRSWHRRAGARRRNRG